MSNQFDIRPQGIVHTALPSGQIISYPAPVKVKDVHKGGTIYIEVKPNK